MGAGKGRSVFAAIAVAIAASQAGMALAQSSPPEECRTEASRDCLLALLATAEPSAPSIDLVEALALAGRTEAASDAAARTGAGARVLVSAIVAARAGDTDRAVEIANRAPPEIKDRALGDIAAVTAGRGNIARAIKLAGQVAAPDGRAETFWHIATIEARSGSTRHVGATVDRALRTKSKGYDNVRLVLGTLVRRGDFDAVTAFLTRRRRDGNLGAVSFGEPAVNLLIDSGHAEAARRLVARLEREAQKATGEGLKSLATLVIRSYAELRSPAAVKRVYKRYADHIDPSVMLSALAQSGDALMATAIAWGTKFSSLSPEIVVASQLLVALGQYRSGDKTGARATAKSILDGLPKYKKLRRQTATEFRLEVLAATAQIDEALKLAERLKPDATNYKFALAWHILPYVTASRETAAMVRFLDYLASTRAVPVTIFEGDFPRFCDEIARKAWAGKVAQSRAIAAALLRASLADPKSHEWDHQGVATCQLRAGDDRGAIATIRKLSDGRARRRFYLMALKLTFGA